MHICTYLHVKSSVKLTHWRGRSHMSDLHVKFSVFFEFRTASVLHTETIKTVRCESESLTCNIIAEIKSGERKFELWLWSNGCRFHYLCHSLFKLFFGSIKSLGADLGSTWYCIQHFLVFYLKKPLIRTPIISSFKSH